MTRYHDVSDGYAEGTAGAWDRKMAAEDAAEAREEAERDRMSGISHAFTYDPNFPALCALCGGPVVEKQHRSAS